jgi:hypothetical protein
MRIAFTRRRCAPGEPGAALRDAAEQPLQLYETRSLDDVNDAFADDEHARTRAPRVVFEP